VTPPQAVLDLMTALYEGDWEHAETSSGSHRSQASGLVAAHLQWHLERQLRTLPLVERPERVDRSGAQGIRQDMAHGNGTDRAAVGQDQLPSAAPGA
jgi:DNA repair protein RecO (recombination protein O)